MEMSTVGESQDPPWKDVLDTKGLSAAAPILEEYGLSCESDMSLVDEDDLVVLCSKLKPCCCEKSQNLNPFNRAAVVCL